MDSSTKEAAILLWQVKCIATKELNTTADPQEPPFQGRSRAVSICSPTHEGSFDSTTADHHTTSPPIRSSEVLAHNDIVKAFCDNFDWSNKDSSPRQPEREASMRVDDVAPPIIVPLDHPTTKTPMPSPVVPRPTRSPGGRNNRLVGLTAKIPVRGVLRRKFAWKQYPELEDFLVRHREEYFVYSSTRNYTPEQKRYNNELTQSLLDLAADKGYIFEDFTFPMIRDRIRCFYKSWSSRKRRS